MKFTSAVSVLMASMASFASADMYQAHINVGCNGVNFHGLSEPEKEFSALQLTLAYNQIRQISDNGDMFLSDITSEDSVGAKTAGRYDSFVLCINSTAS